MKLFLDSGDITEIKEGYSLGVIDGITINPLMLDKSFKGDNKEFLKEFLKLNKHDPVIISLSSKKPEQLIKEAIELKKFYDNIIIKLYMTEEHISILNELKKLDIKAHVSLIFSINQAFIAAKAGAAVLSPFLGRTDDMGGEGSALLADILKMIDEYGFNCEVMAASIRSPYNTAQAIKLGAPIITLPLNVLKKMFYHPATEIGAKEFENAK